MSLLSPQEINEATFVSLANENVGAGIIPSGKANWKIAQQYATQEMIQLLENISRQPIQCYSQKVKGKEKEYFLGKNYVDNLIDRLKKSIQ